MPGNDAKRLRLSIRGAVQGVGFRPFVFRLAEELELAGRVANDSRGVVLEVEGPGDRVEAFLDRLPRERPPLAILLAVEPSWHEPAGYDDFRIEHSDEAGEKTALVLPDVATCADCLAEVFDATDRRYRYPFTNCTNCGPRFTIIRALPYDRPNTTMERFRMCPACQGEYEDPRDRRFHAQPNACPECGPQVALWNERGENLVDGEEALRRAAAAVEEGRILAVKGLGGFHLMVDAGDGEAVARLRRRKHRYEKPLALMAPDLDAIRDLCFLPEAAAELLATPEAPILLLERRSDAVLAEEIAPDNPYLGVMLPYAPLHHLLLRRIGFPVVATSGNLSDEPIATDNSEAIERLRGIADLFLVHDRPIARHVDDSVARVLEGAPRLVRRARGYAPLPVMLKEPVPTILAVGGHLKNTVALSVGDQVFVSQHIGDMETPQARDAFERVIRDFLDLYEAEPVAIVHDLHPDYPSTRWARSVVEGDSDSAGWKAALAGLPLVGVQHHHAHLVSCLADNGVDGPALGVTWDGTGHGTDATVWGGEFLRGDAAGFERVAHLRPFRLPGGEAAIKEPRRSSLALLWDLWGEDVLNRRELNTIAAFTGSEPRVLVGLLERGFRAPVTTSAGRLFDAVASLLGLHQRTRFEGQAAMALEFVADQDVDDAYPLPLEAGEPTRQLDWRPLVEAILEDWRRGTDAGIISARFHNALADAVVTVARETVMRETVTRETVEPRVALTGGCFQNRLLTERTAQRLRRAGFEVLLQRQVPANDGGISLGQVAIAAAWLAAGDGG
ncbi:MAG: carbamoyltransferase HypF [bacterium]|nr:carbamoyltransferase HypF [bacterium]